jgi:hypothetical protein
MLYTGRKNSQCYSKSVQVVEDRILTWKAYFLGDIVTRNVNELGPQTYTVQVTEINRRKTVSDLFVLFHDFTTFL